MNIYPENVQVPVFISTSFTMNIYPENVQVPVFILWNIHSKYKKFQCLWISSS